MLWGQLAGSDVGRAHFCDDAVLRITERCLIEDFGLPADIDFESAAKRQAIVRAFAKQRCADPIGGADTNWLGATPREGDTGYAWLRHGERERAITWFDEDNKIVWLVAYHPKHTSGPNDPAQEYFVALRDAGSLLPTKADAMALLKDLDDARARLLLMQGRYMLDRARETDAEVKDSLLGELDATVRVEYEPGVEAVTFAFKITNQKRQNREIHVLLAALYPEGWEMVFVMPSGRELEPNELAWQHYHAK